MIRSELLEDEAVLIVTPEGPLTSQDFARLAAEVDPFIEKQGTLRGLMIQAESFPGWQDFAGLLSHLSFVRDHHRRIKKVAAVSDSAILTFLPRIIDHFVGAEVRHFDHADRDAALAWLSDR